MKHLSLNYVLFLPLLVRNFEEIGVFILSANMIQTVQSMKPVECLRKREVILELIYSSSQYDCLPTEKKLENYNTNNLTMHYTYCEVY